MGAALRVTGSRRVQYSTFKFVEVGAPNASLPACFIASFATCELPNETQCCWLPIFENPVIARGFPVPVRENGEQGLEVPLEIMAALGGVRHVTDFEGGLILKGHSAMFVPVKRFHQSIQWHLIRCGDEQRILYREVNAKCPNRTTLNEVDHESLRNARAFLGWWKSAETHLGTADAAYHRIDWSSAGEARRPASISGANIGFSHIMTGQLSFILGAKDGRLHFSQRGPFQRIVQCAEKTPVVLHDLADRRAWLVPALDVMLHIVQTRHHISPYKIDGTLVQLAAVAPELGRAAATETVAANQSRQLYERDAVTENPYCFKDALLDIWSLMERLMEKEGSIEANPGLALRGTMQTKVYGWEYMSLVHEKNYRRKEALVAKSSGGWVNLANDIDALVLFATGLGDVIRPVSDLGNLCKFWRTLPHGKDFLAAGVPILEMLYSEAGSSQSRKHLSTSHLQWNRGHTLFELCSSNSSRCCGCDRTQQINYDSFFKTLGPVRSPGRLEENGCVVFGQMQHSFKPHTKIPVRQNAVHILPNTPFKYREASRQDTQQADRILSPSPAAVSPRAENTDEDVVYSSKRSVSPLKSATDLEQSEEMSSTRRRRKLSHAHTIESSQYKSRRGGKDETSLLSDRTPEEQLPMISQNGDFDGQVSGYGQTKRAPEAGYAPSEPWKTIRRKANFDDQRHPYGCTCTTCNEMEFELPDDIEDVSSNNNTRVNSMGMA